MTHYILYGHGMFVKKRRYYEVWTKIKLETLIDDKLIEK